MLAGIGTTGSTTDDRRNRTTSKDISFLQRALPGVSYYLSVICEAVMTSYFRTNSTSYNTLNVIKSSRIHIIMPVEERAMLTEFCIKSKFTSTS